MTGEIRRLGATNEQGTDAVIIMLEEALSDLRASRLSPSKALFLCMTTEMDGEPAFKTNWYNAGMRMSECLATVETAKALFLKEMGYS